MDVINFKTCYNSFKHKMRFPNATVNRTVFNVQSYFKKRTFFNSPLLRYEDVDDLLVKIIKAPSKKVSVRV